MRSPGWLGVGERRWKKSPDEDVQPSKTVWDLLQLLIVAELSPPLVSTACAEHASLGGAELLGG
jgi:hypothetical protein